MQTASRAKSMLPSLPPLCFAPSVSRDGEHPADRRFGSNCRLALDHASHDPPDDNALDPTVRRQRAWSVQAHPCAGEHVPDRYATFATHRPVLVPRPAIRLQCIHPKTLARGAPEGRRQRSHVRPRRVDGSTVLLDVHSMATTKLLQVPAKAGPSMTVPSTSSTSLWERDSGHRCLDHGSEGPSRLGQSPSILLPDPARAVFRASGALELQGLTPCMRTSPPRPSPCF